MPRGQPHPGLVGSNGVVFCAAVIATVCLALASVDALLATFGPLNSSSRSAVALAGRSVQIDADPSTLSTIPLFGEDVADEPTALVAESLPATTLPLKLIGPVASLGGDAQASALISLPDGRQTRIRVEEEIIPGVMLKQVKRTQVIISRNGNSETLSLARPLRVSELRDRTIDVSYDEAGRVSANGASAESREDAIERETDQSPLTIAELVAELPGFASFLQSKGFQAGDQVIAIEGQEPPTDDASLREALVSWIELPSITITVQRGGSVINQKVELSEISTL